MCHLCGGSRAMPPSRESAFDAVRHRWQRDRPPWRGTAALTHSLAMRARQCSVLQSVLPYGHRATVRLARWPAVQCWLALASAYTEAHAPRNQPRHQVLPVLWVPLRVLYGNAPGIGRGMRPSTGGQGEVASNCTANSGVEISTRTFSESPFALRARLGSQRFSNVRPTRPSVGHVTRL